MDQYNEHRRDSHGDLGEVGAEPAEDV